jgi:acetolactate synthase-1/2/3 large subunit
MKASDYVADTLARKGVRVVFELVGGMITHLLDSIHQRGEIEIVSVHHEQAAAFAAEAAGRITGIPGVAMATSGPGATNLLTGIASCYFDSSPAVFITGQVNRSEQRGTRAIRQLGFQETDIVTMAKPITKQAWLVQDAEELPAILDEAFRLAVSGRPGPVLVDIPMDVQRASIQSHPEPPPAHSAQPEDHAPFSASQAAEIRDALKKAQRPMILAGGGIRSSRTAEAFRAFVAAAGVPVVHSLMGADLLPSGEPMNVGMIGSYGNRWANLALAQSDCLLVVGSRLDVRQTGAQTESFKGERPIFHIDCEPGELNNRIIGCVAIPSELAPAFAALRAAFLADSARLHPHAAWLEEIARLRAQWPDTAELNGVDGINPNVFMHALSAAFPNAEAFVVDVGQHQMWAAQSLDLTAHQRFLTSGGLGSMGYSLPSAIGTAITLRNKTVVCIAGDGSFQCNLQELQTVARLGLPIKIVIINNESHGMVRQFQESYFDSRFQSTVWGYSAPDFARVAEAFGIPGRTVSEPEQVADGIAWLSSEAGSPALLQVMISPRANAYPKLAFGHGMESMEPFAQPLDMEGT